MRANDEFIGRGWAYPLRTSPSGGIAMVDKDQELVESIRLILGTAPGERPMRPEFGCFIHDYVFAAPTPTIRGEMRVCVEEALRRWEPRIVVVGVDLIPDTADPALLYIQVRFRPATENSPRNLVFPFYTIPGGEE